MNTKQHIAASVLCLCLAGLIGQGSLAGNSTSRDVEDTLEQKAPLSAQASRTAFNAAAWAGERVVVAGVRGSIVYSDDQGQTWKQANVPVSVSLTAVCFTDKNSGWAVGHRGVILKSVDGGQSWVRQLDGFQAAQAIVQQYRDDPERAGDARRLVDEGADKPFLAVQCLGAGRALAVGAYGLAFATADGEHWAPALAVLTGADAHHLNAVQLLGGQVYLAGEAGGLMRVDGDLQHFSRLEEPYDGSFFGLLTTRSNALLALGLRGHLFRSEDRGSTWQSVTLATTKSLTAATLLSDGGVLLADESGAGWLSRDDGRTFRQVNAAQHFPLVALLGTRDGASLAVGTQGITRFLPAALH